MAKSCPPSEEDKRLALEYARKAKAKEKTTLDEQRALRRVQAFNEQRDRDKYYRTVPKRDYVAMSGRQHKVLDEQAARYDLPLLGESVDLFALLKRFHDLFAEGRFRTDDDLDDETQQTPNLEKLRGEKYRLAKLDRLERQRQLLPRRLVRELLGFNAAKLRNLGEQLQRRFGPEALDALNDTIDEIARETARTLDNETPTTEEPTDDDT